jgi:hypothetical protein
MATITYKYGGNGVSGLGNITSMGMFLKVPSAPAGDTTIWDFYAGAPGYWRCKLTSGLHLILEWDLFGSGIGPFSGSLDMFAGAISTGLWYWLSAGEWAHFDGGHFNQMRAQVSGPGGSGPGVQIATLMSDSDSWGNIWLSCTFGIGVSLSSGYANFPNSSGWEWSKVNVQEIAYYSGGVLGMPSSDVSSGVAAYMCRQSVGAQSTLTDSSGSALTLSAGPQGLTINADGPYA